MLETLKEECELVNFCIWKTAVCRVSPPDEGCYYYRYFKKIIERVEENKNKEGNNT
jgi:hypothetical protein